MNILNYILVIDVNVIVHLEKVGLLDHLANDKNVRIVDLVLYQEYEYKENPYSNSMRKIKRIHLNEEQMYEAQGLYMNNKKNSIFDYYSYIASRDNGYILLTGDNNLRKYAQKDVEVHGAIWYVELLNKKGIISEKELKRIYEIWLNDKTIFIDSNMLIDLISKLDEKIEELETI